MKIAVLGPGALGCLLGSRLREAGEDVILLDRDAERATTIAREGVRIESSQGIRTVRVPVTSEPATVGKMDLLVVAVKAYDTRAAVEQWRGVLGEGTILLTLQNGLGNVEVLLETAPKECPVVGGSTGEGATRIGPGHSLHAGSGETVLAAARGGAPAAEAAAAPLERAGLSVRLGDDVHAVIWSKFLTNVGVNALAGVLGLSNGDLCDREEARAVIRDLIREASEVGRRKGVRLPSGDAARRAEEVLRLTADNTNSLLQDLRRGRRTEIDALNGMVVEEGKAQGLETPVNRALWGMVRTLESRGEQKSARTAR